MATTFVFRKWVGLAGLALCCFAGPVAAQLPNLTVNYTFKIDVNCQHPYLRNLAPWWTYFPQDPHLTAHGPRHSVYPNWPQPFPPEGSNEGSPMSRPQPAQRPPGPIVQQRSPFSPSAQAYPSWIQPAGYVSSAAPGYWYGR